MFSDKKTVFLFALIFTAGCGLEVGEKAAEPVYQYRAIKQVCDTLDYKSAFREVFEEENAELAAEKIRQTFQCLIFKTGQYKSAIQGESLNKTQLKNLLNEKFIKKKISPPR